MLPDGTAIGYLIDAQNRRVGKTVNDTLVRAWLYQGQLTPVAELDGSGNVVSRFVYATGVNVPDYMIRGDSTYRLIRDHLGSVRVVVNAASGSVAQRLSYDEFGIETENTNANWQPFGYAGGLTDGHTGLTRFGARDYDPQVGRWTAKDPIGFAGGSSSVYTYAYNDPVNYVDAEGEMPILVVVVFKAAGGGALVGAAFSTAMQWIFAGEVCADQVVKDAILGAVGGAVIGGLRAVLIVRAASRLARFPANPAQLKHIFRREAGHVADTPANRQLISDVANNAANRLGTDKFGNVWSAATRSDGSQVWVSTRNGVIQNGGVNTTPRVFTDFVGR